MIYYVNDNKLYCSQAPISHSDFIEISAEEYDARLSKAVSGRETGTPANNPDSE